MKSFQLQKTSGNDDVTKESLLWLLVLVLVIAPILIYFAAPLLTGVLDSTV